MLLLFPYCTPLMCLITIRRSLTVFASTYYVVEASTNYRRTLFTVPASPNHVGIAFLEPFTMAYQ